ncbi:Box C/D snoRNA protein 1like [Caligus rogercresseyi]|uniref:Box C/D snoRNA protein 1like n=1 Tax=Caligus rogercresseyi TaxID=217165 RepID=A0A7T8KI29_CALRO|nr:Box C/D snoRNA protein 1like [Caligus rogercresseyi]
MSSAFDTLGSISRDKLRKITCKGENALKIPFSVRELINANRLRGCRYLVLPPHFQRSKTNSSKLIYKRNRILWKVEWVFPHAENLTILTRLGDHLEGLIAQDSKRKMEEEDKD